MKKISNLAVLIMALLMMPTNIVMAKSSVDKGMIYKYVGWQEPSDGKYPDIKDKDNINIYVSTKKQRVYIRDGKKKIYTMICSTGKKNTTPKGKFKIEAERGETFFNRQLNEGANYWTSFKDHGVYLFHSVPTIVDGSYNEKEAYRLGNAASHGCVRLTVADAKWIFDNIPQDVSVKIA